MSSHTPTMRERAAARWAAAKPVAIALCLGLVAGPIVTSMAGFQVTRGTAQAATRAAVVEQQARFCEERVRAAVPEAGRLDWSRSYELSRQWSIMPGSAVPDIEVAQACARRLAG